MRLKFFLPIVTLCVFIISPAIFAETYYVSMTGNDNASGTSWSQAWRSTTKVSNSLNAGDTVLFGTGKWFNTQIVPPEGGGTAGWTVYACSTFAAGGDGSDSWNRTMISGGDSVLNWTQYDVSGGRNIWQASWSGSGCWSGAASNDGGSRSFMLTQNDKLLKCVLSVGDINEEGKWTHIESSGRIYAWIENGQNPNNTEMISSCKPVFRFPSDNHKKIKLYGLDLRHGKQGVVLFTSGACDSIQIIHCRLKHVGHDFGENPAVIMSRAKNFDGPYFKFASHILIRGCDISSSRGTAASYYEHAGTGIEMYCTKYAVVDSCYIHDVYGNGVMWKNQDALSNDSIAVGNVVKFTTFENIVEFGYVGGNNSYKDSVYGCTFINCGEAGMDPNHGSSIDFGRHFLCNNTFYRCSMFLWNRYPMISNDSTCQFKYNIMYSNEADNPPDYYGNWVRMGPGQAGYQIDYNIWYDPASSFDGLSTCGSSWSAWQSCGFDQHGAIANPGFANVSANNFSRPSSTAEINVTYGGKTWTRIGAWQPGDDVPPDTTQPDGNLAAGITPTVSGTYTGYSVAAITDGATVPDGGPSTTWASEQSSNAHWVVIDFGQNRTFEGIRIYWAWNSFGSSWTNSQRYQIQRWNGSAYVDVITVSTADTLSFVTTEDTVVAHTGHSVTVQSNDSCVTVTGFSPITTSRLRIYQPPNMGSVGYPTIMWMTELEVYNLDIVPPAIETPDLGALPGSKNGQIDLFWKAPGDDGLFGTAGHYVLKYKKSMFTTADWDNLPSLFNPPTPSVAGSQESMTANGMEPGVTYFIALKAFDEAGNESPMTNPAEVVAFQSQIAQGTEDSLFIESPVPGAELHTAHPILTVKNYDRADTNVYFFEVSRNIGFTNLIAVSGDVIQEPWETTSWQVTESLHSGTDYYWRARANGAIMSDIYEFTVAPQTHAYPNPFNRSTADRAVFTELPLQGNIVLMTVSGTTVKYLANTNGEDVSWDGTNQQGEPLASGTYLWFVEGTDVNGKIVLTY